MRRVAYRTRMEVSVLDLENETVLPLSEAPRHPMLRRGRRPGRPIHRSTLERWRCRGCRGVRLETELLGGIRVTTVQALTRFFERLSRPGAPADAPTPSDVRRAHAVAERELEAAGL
jgi:hypothetical protein